MTITTVASSEIGAYLSSGHSLITNHHSVFLLQCVDSLRKPEVELGEAALAVRRENQAHLVVTNVDVRMVFFFFRYFGHGIHEIDRIGKIVKLKRALDMLFLQLPLRNLFHALFQVACFDQVSHNGTTSNTRNLFCNRENRRVLFVTPATASGADFASWKACTAAKGRE